MAASPHSIVGLPKQSGAVHFKKRTAPFLHHANIAFNVAFAAIRQLNTAPAGILHATHAAAGLKTAATT